MNSNKHTKKDSGYSKAAMYALSIYLTENGILDIERLSMPDKKKAFIKFYHDYSSYQLSLDEFSYLTETLWWSIEGKDTEFAQIVHVASELTYYERQVIKQGEVSKMFLEFLREVHEYIIKSETQKSRE